MAKKIYRIAKPFRGNDRYVEVHEDGRFVAWLQVTDVPRRHRHLLCNPKEIFGSARCTTKAKAALLVKRMR